MKLNIILLTVMVAVGAALTVWFDGRVPLSETQPAKTEISSPQEREKAPDFAFTTLAGDKHRLSDFKGKIVLLNFWATWCAPCVIEFPKLAALAKTNDDIVVLALSSDMTDSAVERFLKKQKTSLPPNVSVARDDGRAVTADLYQTFKLPETLVISPEGNIVRKIVGDTDWTGPEIAAFLAALKR